MRLLKRAGCSLAIRHMQSPAGINHRLMLDALVHILNVTSPVGSGDIAVSTTDNKCEFAAAVTVIRHLAPRTDAQQPEITCFARAQW